MKTTKQHKNTQKQLLQHKINTKSTPGLVAFYDIWPGNGVGLFSKEKTSKEGDKYLVRKN